MKTSKYLALGLSVALALSLVSCGRGQQTQEPEEPKQGTQQTEPVTSEPLTQPIETSQVVNQQTQQVPEESKAPEEENKGAEEGNTDDVTGDTNTGENDTLGENEYFTPVNEIVYATGTVNIRSGPSVDTEKVGR